ncbi:MAG: amidohydrolase family protein [Lachnospiraceae bacterium]|nr:amidohydrolase family protein [Lachnospiraceae bacterium]
MIIDFHTHCFPDRLADKTINKLSKGAGGLVPYHNGTLSDLKRLNKESEVSLSVVLNIATNAKQMHNVNNFAIEINKEEGICAFGSVHPDAPDVLDELDRIKENGLKGVKFHPDFQGFYANDPKMKPIYRKISELGLITSFHCGKDYSFPAPYHAMPEHMTEALKMLDTPVIAAHWGALARPELVIEKLCGLPLYFDTAYGYGQLSPQEALKIIEKHGADRILLASDAPWQNINLNLRLLESLDLSTEDLDKIKYKNAVKLLKL